MSAGTSQMSFWIKFFSEAGIPAGISANYAVIFSENRIQQDMLNELSKEYLSDMGITILGDVIAILRHSKQVHIQSTRDKALKGTGTRTGSPSSRRSTPASRTVNHYIGKDPEAGPMNQTTPLPGPKISTELASRLGSTPTEPSVVKKITMTALTHREEVPVPKKRRVLPEHEGKYKVIMPKGTTEKTKKILNQKQAEKGSSVFARLGQSSETEVSASTSTGTVTITGLGKMVLKSPNSTTQAGLSSVFNRLGSTPDMTIKRAASSTCPDSDDSDSYEAEPLGYAGVLKATPEEKKAEIQRKKTVLERKKKKVPTATLR